MGLFHRVKELFKPNQTGYGVYHRQVESKTKKILVMACLGKKLVLQSEISSYSLIIRLFYFQNIEILSGQGVVQIKPNWVWSISCVSRVKKQK